MVKFDKLLYYTVKNIFIVIFIVKNQCNSVLFLEDKFEWIDGCDLSYTNWDRGQPDNQNNVEACGEVWKFHQQSLTWNDANCQNKHGFICSVKKGIRIIIIDGPS